MHRPHPGPSRPNWWPQSADYTEAENKARVDRELESLAARGEYTMYTFTCRRTAETQDTCVCQRHAKEMPLVDGDRIRAEPCEGPCEFCPVKGAL
jgi:hypothetical protein